MSEQQCVQCTWDGVKLVKMCKHHEEIDTLTARLAAAEAERGTAKKLQLEYLDQAVQRGKQLVQADDAIERLRGENEKLRGLLREFVEDQPPGIGSRIVRRGWFDECKAALEGKP